jgi:NAD(P)H-flavin reductase/hemoglobin-like flavoprotein
MTEPLLISLRSGERDGAADETAATVQSTFTLVAHQPDELARHFFATLFGGLPRARELFPVNLEEQRGHLARALMRIVQTLDRPDELRPTLEQLGREHRRFAVLAQHGDLVEKALLGPIAAAAGPAWTPVVEKSWKDAFATVTTALLEAARAERGPTTWVGRVVEHRRLGWDLAVVGVRTDEPVPYRAGQFLSVEIPQRPRLWRSLSPANAPSPDGLLEFHVRAVPGGWVSGAMVAHSRIGDPWRIGPARGQMLVDRHSARDVLMVAGGTGAAPVRALLEELSTGDGQPRVQVFVGGRTWDDLYDITTLRRLSYAASWLDVIPVVQSDDDGLGGAERGTLAEVVTRYGAWADHDIIVCGSPAMIRATVSRMLVAGTPLDRITYDPFTDD